jgi:Rieske Fe-S protein
MSAEITRRSAARGAMVAGVGVVAGVVVARTSSAADEPAGGHIVSSPPVVVVRTSAEHVVGFSAICTHQGCTVTSISNSTIDCPCHGSQFALTTGKVVAGPAPRPLPAVAVEVRNGQVYTK